MRLFIAIELPAYIRDALDRIQAGIPGAKWVLPENLHLTLRFLGDADGMQAEDLAYELARIDMNSFEIGLDGVGHFAGGAGVKSVWMGVAPQEPLIALHGKVERACRRAGFPGGRQAFKPHITLARFRYPPEIGRTRRFLERYGRFRREPFRVSGFSLFSSELRPEGPIYRIEADFPFTDAGIGDSPFFGDWDEAAARPPIRTK